MCQEAACSLLLNLQKTLLKEVFRMLKPKKNLGLFDRILRITLGVLLLAYGFINYWAIPFGLFALYEGLNSWCILYQLFGINTCPINKK
jgi:hypothetical protein